MQVEVVAEVDGWLHCMASNGAKGLVPSSYVQLLGAGGSNGLQQQYSSAVSVQQQLCMLPFKHCLWYSYIAIAPLRACPASVWGCCKARIYTEATGTVHNALTGFGTTQQTLR